jgi:DNA-binding response OmpR family regulator
LRATILVVDDDPSIQRLLEQILRTHDFDVVLADDGARVLNLVQTRRPVAIVLDLKMPNVSGLEALRAVRAAGEDVPIIVLTGVLEEDWVLDAFDAGADDYVTKPFRPRVLVARLQALLRRRQPAAVEGMSDERVGEVALDARTHTARIGDRAVSLSPTEYELLRVLMRGAGRVFTPDDLLVRVWGKAYLGQDEIIRANIYRLRHKLEPVPNEPRYILGRRGVGYFFSDVGEPAATPASA